MDTILPARPDLWQSLAHVALVLSLIAPGAFYVLAGILTCPHGGDASDDA